MDHKQAFFRVDASFKLGYGHIHRCITLANSFASIGVNCSFICKDLEGLPKNLIRSQGHKLELISSSDLKNNWLDDVVNTKNIIKKAVDYIIVDHYEINYLWQQELKKLSKHLIVIDDLANKKHDCDILINQNLGTVKEDYINLVSQETKLFIGPQYALLRPEFKEFRDFSIKRRKNLTIKNLLISLGGVDKNNFVYKVLSALKKIEYENLSQIDVIIGNGNNKKESLKKISDEFSISVNFYENITNMAEIMSRSDLIIGAGGISSWERCSLGIPSIIFILASNQKRGAYALEKEKCSILIQNNKSFKDELKLALNYYSNASNLKDSIDSCLSICEGDGVNKILASI